MSLQNRLNIKVRQEATAHASYIPRGLRSRCSKTYVRFIRVTISVRRDSDQRNVRKFSNCQCRHSLRMPL